MDEPKPTFDRATAVVLLNMGGPASLDQVEPFLKELFSDPAILGMPGPLRRILAARIARKRAPHSRERYERYGGMSPLLDNTRAQSGALQDVLGCPVREVMRYGQPGADAVLAGLADLQIHQLVAVSLFPQYSTTTSKTALDNLAAAAARANMSLTTVESYPTHEGFVRALSEAGGEALEGVTDGSSRPHLLFAAHGIPLSRVRRGDPYPREVEATCQAVAGSLGISESWSLAYQSRVGPTRWLEPSVEAEVRRLAGAGVDGIAVQPVTFACENLETMDDLDRDLAREVQDVGIAHFRRGAAPGVHPAFIDTLATLAREAALSQGWYTE